MPKARSANQVKMLDRLAALPAQAALRVAGHRSRRVVEHLVEQDLAAFVSTDAFKFDLVEITDAGRLAQHELRDLYDDDKIWIILKEPNLGPQRKGPFDPEWTKRFIREVMDHRPTAYIIVLEPDGTGGFWPEDGGTWLHMRDRRSLPKSRRYWTKTREAHGDHTAPGVHPTRPWPRR